MIIVALLFALSCAFESDSVCDNSTDCTLDSVCRDGTCASVACFGSTDCGWSEHCEAGVCVVGCERDGDCMAGGLCQDGECVESTCQNTQIDCAFGQYCLQGECIDSELPVCERCDYSEWQQGMADNRECVTYRFFQEQTCSWPDAIGCEVEMSCFPGSSDEGPGICVELFAFSYCQSDDDCPQGFSCWLDIYGEGSGVSVCETNCNSYLDVTEFLE